MKTTEQIVREINRRESDRKKAEDFRLANAPPKPPKGPPIFNLGGQQRVLFAALGDSDDQGHLFDSDCTDS